MMAAPERSAVPEPPPPPTAAVMAPGRPAPGDDRATLRLHSLAWACLTAAAAGLVGLFLIPFTAEPPTALPGGLALALRSAGCGFFLGLLAFHLQRVDPDDGHLQAGLVGAVCGIRSLGAGTSLPPLPQGLDAAGLLRLAPSLMMELAVDWLPLWLPVIGSALVLHGLLHGLRPGLRPGLLPGLRRRLPSPQAPPPTGPQGPPPTDLLP